MEIMKNLDEEQINAVLAWMENWDQLKGTAIPFRFKEDWSKCIPNTVKPPLGLTPKWIHDQHRQGEIMKAMSRYLEAGEQIPKEWALEFASYCETKTK